MRIVINGEFASINEFIDANRRRHGSWSGGNEMKRRDQGMIEWQLPRWHTDRPIWIHYTFYCKNRKRDKDNIAGYFHKIFQDALVAHHCINNDGWKDIIGFSDEFYVDARNPRIEIEIQEDREWHRKK